MFDSNEINLKKLNLQSLKGKEFKILATRGKLKSYKRKSQSFRVIYLLDYLETNQMIC